MQEKKSKKVLIGCEESQTVCMAFRNLGFDAYSCDLKKCSGGYPSYHIQGDIYEAIKMNDWDFIGLHPDCTKITFAGNRHYAKGCAKYHLRVGAVEWTIQLWKYVCSVTNFAYMENPFGALNVDSRLSKPQIIHPYYFGDSFQKQTCIWLHGLPKLLHNDRPNLFDTVVTHVSRGGNESRAVGKGFAKMVMGHLYLQ